MIGCALVPLALHRWIWRQRRARTTRPPPEPQASADRRSACSASSNWCTANPSRPGRSCCARRPCSKSPSMRSRAISAMRCRSRGTSGAAGWPPARWRPALLSWRSTRRRHRTPGRASCSRGATRRATPLPWSNRCPIRWSWRTANHFRCRSSSPSKPSRGRTQAEARIGAQPPVVAPLAEGGYSIECPPQIEPAPLDVRVGDFTKRIRLDADAAAGIDVRSKRRSYCPSTSAARRRSRATFAAGRSRS